MMCRLIKEALLPIGQCRAEQDLQDRHVLVEGRK